MIMQSRTVELAKQHPLDLLSFLEVILATAEIAQHAGTLVNSQVEIAN